MRMQKDELAITITLLTVIGLVVAWAVLQELVPTLPGEAPGEEDLVAEEEASTAGEEAAEPEPEPEPEPAGPEPPVAEKRPQDFMVHGQTLTDDYAWLRDADYPKVDDEDVLAYLEAENTYYDAIMGEHSDLVDTLFEEMKARIDEDEESVPVKDGPWLYGWRYAEGAQYRTWVRSPSDEAPEDAPEGEQVIFDETERAGDRDFYRLGGFGVSENHRLLAFSEDLDGSERYTMRVKDLKTGEILEDEIPETLGDPVWDSKSTGFLYSKLDENWRPFQIRYHAVGTPAADDVVLYEESDPGFFVRAYKTQSRRFIVIMAEDSITSEARIVPASDPTGEQKVVAERKTGHEYDVDHAGFKLYIRTNDTHPNFRIVAAPPAMPWPENWKEILPPSDDRYFMAFIPFKDFMAIEERTDGLDQIRVRAYSGEEHLVPFEEPAYKAMLGDTREFEVESFRIEYESMVTPETIFDYEVASQKLVTRKVQEVPSGHDPSQYAVERVMAPARDGVEVPVTILYRKGFEKNGEGPLHIYGYGAYGYSVDPGFDIKRLSLVDRGFAYAIAHVRGGDMMGRRWFEQGRLLDRKNTFTDFVDVAKHLVAEGWSSEGRISISGASAGGELMGAVVNSDPELWGAVVAHVPFVDVLNTMLDEDLPLTPIEWPIWGNPIEDPEAFEYIRSYSPYDQVKPQDYPPMLVTAGINDPRVTYWEPAKWVAKLRAHKTDDDLLLLHTNMGAGHLGKSGRYERLRETAEEYAFILVLFDLTGE